MLIKSITVFFDYDGLSRLESYQVIVNLSDSMRGRELKPIVYHCFNCTMSMVELRDGKNCISKISSVWVHKVRHFGNLPAHLHAPYRLVVAQLINQLKMKHL